MNHREIPKSLYIPNQDKYELSYTYEITERNPDTYHIEISKYRCILTERQKFVGRGKLYNSAFGDCDRVTVIRSSI